jgi:CPA2 family monovalent cation:H+ antiporter-2
MAGGLVGNLALALIAAFIGAFVAVRLRQSAVLGYIAAGIVIGPFTPGYVADPEAVEALADLGLVFLLFAIGAELSLRDLLRAGRVAMLGGSIQLIVTIGLGAVLGLALGWTPAAALVFGAALAISSGAVLGKLLGERGEQDSEHGRIAFAWSTVQDLGTILLVVLLPSLAGDGQARLEDVGLAIGKAALFLALLVPFGLRIMPAMFERVALLRSREVFVLAVAAVALGTAFVATLFGVSLALGAFAAGLAVGESDLSHQALAEVVPLRDLLAGVFFVSIGMLVDPGFVVTHIALILLVIAVMVVAKGTIVAGLTRAFGAPLRTALLVGATLAQCGEFSFLLARIGRETGAVTPDVFNLVLSGAVGSIVVAPWVLSLTDRAVRVGERRLGAMAMAREPEAPAGPSRRHAVICGYGDVGAVIAEVLTRRGFSWIAIDQDPRVVRRLRTQGATAVLGSADNPVLLDRVGLERARVLVIAIPNPVAARHIVQYARRTWPRLDIVARTHSQDEVRFLRSRGVNEAVSGEVELSLEMARHTLHRFGVSAAETQAMLHGLRQRIGSEQDDSAVHD